MKINRRDLLKSLPALAAPAAPQAEAKKRWRPSDQKFMRGDTVRVGKLPAFMSHFPGEGAEAIVCGSYADRFHETWEEPTYTLLLPKDGEVSWYDEGLLTLVRESDGDALTALEEYRHRARNSYPS